MSEIEQFDQVLTMLENAYTGARAYDDVVMMTRLSRAIVMFGMSPEKNIRDFAYDIIRNTDPKCDDPGATRIEISSDPKVTILLDEFIDQLEFAICEDSDMSIEEKRGL